MKKKNATNDGKKSREKQPSKKRKPAAQERQKTTRKRKTAFGGVHPEPLLSEHPSDSVEFEVLGNRSDAETGTDAASDDNLLDLLAAAEASDEDQEEKAEEDEVQDNEFQFQHSFDDPQLQPSSELQCESASDWDMDLPSDANEGDQDGQDSDEDPPPPDPEPVQPPSEAEPSAADAEAAQPSLPLPPPADQGVDLDLDANVEQVAMPKAKVGRKPPASGGVRDMVSRDVFVVPGVGQLRYYPQTEQIVAFCPLQVTRHQPDCRITRTVAPKTARASGRPIGLLIAWMQKCEEYDHALGHKHSCKPSLQERQAARSLFETIPGWQEFASHEKPSPNGEASEPNKV